MRYRLRTLVILLAICPPLLAWGWAKGQEYRRWLQQRAELEQKATTQRLVQRNTSFARGLGASPDADFAIDWHTEPGPVGDLDLSYYQDPVPDR